MTLFYDTAEGKLLDDHGHSVYPFGVWSSADEVIDFLVFNGLEDYEVVEI